MDIDALFVQQEGGNIDRQLHMHRAGIFLHRLFLQDAQDVQRRRFGAANVAGAVAARAGVVAGFAQRRLQALARHFQQAEARDLAGLHACAVVMQCIAQAVFDLALILRVFHVDEIDHDQSAQVAQTHLASDFIGSFQIGVVRGLLDITALGRSRAELTSTDTRASVWSMTIAPPEGRFT